MKSALIIKRLTVVFIYCFKRAVDANGILSF